MSAGIALLSQKNKVQEFVCKALDMESGHLQSVKWPVLWEGLAGKGEQHFSAESWRLDVQNATNYPQLSHTLPLGFWFRSCHLKTSTARSPCLVQSKGPGCLFLLVLRCARQQTEAN